MSIILKGIDLPRDGESITVTIWSDGIIYATDENKNQIDTKESEAIQIPKDHGRLIDGDELLQRIVSLPSFRTNFEGVPWAVLKDVEVLPEVRHSKAILEAEGEDVHKSNV